MEVASFFLKRKRYNVQQEISLQKCVTIWFQKKLLKEIPNQAKPN
jgi:hypothetical protein